MDMTGEERIEASRETVWAALNDPEVLRQSIPGCEALEKLSDADMTARVKLKIGPVSATFSGKVTLSEVDAPNGYRIAGEGSGGAAGYAKGSALVRLVEDGPDSTILKYEVKADVGGKLAQLGGRLIDATARKLAGEFFRNFGEVVAPPSGEAGAKEEPAGDAKPGVLRRWFSRRKDPTAAGEGGPAES